MHANGYVDLYLSPRNDVRHVLDQDVGTET